MIQKTYAQITREIQALQAHAEKLRAAELQAIVSKLNETIAKYGLKAEDLRFAAAGSTSGAPVRASHQATFASRSASSSIGAKYGDGQGNSWGGRGPRPAWLRDALSKGRTLESFALSGTEASNQTSATQQRSSGKGKPTEQSTAVKSPLPPLYSHPKTGQTWSGRGPKPAWLKQGLKKRGVSLNDFLILARESSGGVTDAAAPSASASPASSKNPRTAKSAAVPQSTGAKKKSLAEKISSRTKASSAATVKPEAAHAPTSATPVAAAKKSAGKKTPAKKSSEVSITPTPAKTAVKTATKRSGTSTASKLKDAPPSVAPAALGKKPASKAPAKAAAESSKKPSTKKKQPVNRRVASSMAPAVGEPPAPSGFAPLATQLAPESGPTEGEQALSNA